ncbi:MAG: DUF4864 domain-containing protein [Burkholderiales bacterium]|jgi:hypothetical protein|uniref:DUF4864 domain-containing protein n=1 Tax=Limnobacter sp. TaxID=2003368 RepID=UPI0039BCA3E7|nr:DUF4864 domain-containing protein [Burkholderiales bacterium]
MPNQTNDVPRRKQALDKENSLRQRIWKLWLVIFAGVLTAAFTTSLAQADETADRQQSRAVIEAQLEAFKQGDAPKAFSYATPNIQTIFGDADTFMKMVRDGYDMVYRPASVRFVKFETDGMNALHAVQMIDHQKTLWNVYYLVEKRPDGTWKISSCEAEKAETDLI